MGNPDTRKEFRAPVETKELKALLSQTICGDYRAEVEAAEKLRALFPDLIREVLAVRASDYDALAREMAEVKAELDALTKEQDDNSQPGLIAAQFITIEELQQNIRNLVKERDEALKAMHLQMDMKIVAIKQRDTARAQIVAAQEDMKERCITTARRYLYRKDDSIERAIRALPLTDPADALAEHDKRIRADERAKCAEVASAETGWDGVPYMSQMQYGPGIGKRIAAAILARGGQEGRG